MRLVTIDSDYLHPEHAACYLREQDGEVAFIETNTAHAVPRLLRALETEELSPEQVRWVIVTHVHLDHAGGAWSLLRSLPNATVVAHPRAARHLIDPAKLVASASAVYGAEHFAELYGSLEPIPAERVRVVEEGDELELGSATFRFHHTRGHANHHFVVHDPARDTVFTGDTFGLIYPRLQRQGRFALATTSPTDFDGAAALKSVDRILALGTATACPTHFGEIDRLAETADQLRWWIERSEQLVEQAAALPEEEAARLTSDGVTAAMEEFVAMRGVQLDAGDRELLGMDLDLNAQGLAFAAAKRRRA